MNRAWQIDRTTHQPLDDGSRLVPHAADLSPVRDSAAVPARAGIGYHCNLAGFDQSNFSGDLKLPPAVVVSPRERSPDSVVFPRRTDTF
jgi:hypothetical protein